MGNISLFVAFIAGVLSFFSPCVFPLIPAYITLITGFSIDEIKNLDEHTYTHINLSIIIRICAFILGFSVIFVLLGISATALGDIILRNEYIIRLIGGIIIIIFGLNIAGIINIKFLHYEKKFHITESPASIIGPFLIGLAFGLGWTPCIGPILASILTIAAIKHSLAQGVLLLSFYSLGLGLPFLFIGIFINWVLTKFRYLTKHIRIFSIISAGLLIIIGILLILGKFL